jgi:hypothetical protein
MTITAPPPRTRTRTRSPQRTPQKTQPQPGRPRPPAEVGAARKTRSAASQRAYDRKAQRQAELTGGVQPHATRRTPFVLLVMGLMAVGLIASLWLSTAAAADSYRLEQAQLQARELAERSALLRQEVANLQTAPELARRARALGMVPSPEPARLVVQYDGTVVVVGKPVAAAGPPPVVMPPGSTAMRPPGQQPQQPGQPARGNPADQDPAVQAAPAASPAQAPSEQVQPAQPVQLAQPPGPG